MSDGLTFKHLLVRPFNPSPVIPFLSLHSNIKPSSQPLGPPGGTDRLKLGARQTIFWTCTWGAGQGVLKQVMLIPEALKTVQLSF